MYFTIVKYYTDIFITFRLEIDKDNYQFLKTTAKEKDVAVMSSALKLFFRELPHPLISIALSDQIRKAVLNGKGTQEVSDLLESRYLKKWVFKILFNFLDHLSLFQIDCCRT